ncbi:MAG: haloacid dehalogenase-like hydrolase [Deltaproteobacteria bacterium]|nr:haloacid dehalogenase-like hydrolase [Deltaproteobacteria bacterium]
MKKYIAFFDIDNTVISATSGKVMAANGYREGLISNLNLMEGLVLSLLYRFKLMKSENVIKLMARWLKGISEKEILDFSTRLFDEHLKDKVREKARLEVDFHNTNGGFTVILSATTRYLSELIKQHDLKDAYYYGDSASDIPVLEVVGHPMCVTPDKKLEKVAMEKGWIICRW